VRQFLGGCERDCNGRPSSCAKIHLKILARPSGRSQKQAHFHIGLRTRAEQVHRRLSLDLSGNAWRDLGLFNHEAFEPSSIAKHRTGWPPFRFQMAA
jgi:hypothetical protein